MQGEEYTCLVLFTHGRDFNGKPRIVSCSQKAEQFEITDHFYV